MMMLVKFDMLSDQRFQWHADSLLKPCFGAAGSQRFHTMFSLVSITVQHGTRTITRTVSG